MSKFYFFLWTRWAVRLILCSVILASVFSFVVTLFVYFSHGTPTFSSEIKQALIDVFWFWFFISWNFTLLIALFRSLKYIFNRCTAGYELKLLSCLEKEVLEDIGYGDLLKVWRKWFMLLIWLVGSMMIIALVITHFFTSYSGVFEWFNIYYLFGFILASGYFSFMIMTARCEHVKIIKC